MITDDKAKKIFARIRHDTRIYVIMSNKGRYLGVIIAHPSSATRMRISVGFANGDKATDTCAANDSAQVSAVLACIEHLLIKSQEQIKRRDRAGRLYRTLYKDMEDAGTLTSLSTNSFKIISAI